MICATVIHNKCVPHLKNIQIISEIEKTINCCVNSDDIELSFTNANENSKDSTINKVEIFYLKYIIKQKDAFIAQQNSYIECLNNQIILLKSLKENKYSNYGNVTPSILESITEKIQPRPETTTPSIGCDQIAPSVIDLNTTENYTLINSTATKNQLQNAESQIYVADMTNSTQKRQFEPKTPTAANDPVLGDRTASITECKNNPNYQTNTDSRKNNSRNKRRTFSNKPIIGQLEIKNNKQVKTINKRAFLHVHKTHPEMSCDELRSLISDLCPEAEVHQLNSQFPKSYSSFKVIVDLTNLDKVMTPNIWPKGCCVNRFFHRKKTVAATS